MALLSISNLLYRTSKINETEAAAGKWLSSVAGCCIDTVWMSSARVILARKVTIPNPAGLGCNYRASASRNPARAIPCKDNTHFVSRSQCWLGRPRETLQLWCFDNENHIKLLQPSMLKKGLIMRLPFGSLKPTFLYETGLSFFFCRSGSFCSLVPPPQCFPSR